MRLSFILHDGVSDTGLSLGLDAFAQANRLLPELNLSISPWDIQLLSAKRQVITQRGMRVSTVPFHRADRSAVAFVPAPGDTSLANLTVGLGQAAWRSQLTLLARWAEGGTMMAAACAGTFVLAAAGLATDHQVTTAWWLASVLRSRYPRVQVAENNMLVHDRNVVTAGAFLGHLDLALWLIRQRSAALADLTARYLVATPSTSQVPFMVPHHVQHSDPVVRRFEEVSRQRIREPLTIAALAKACFVSEGSLQRRVQAACGRSPLAQVQQWRMEVALYLVRTSAMSVADAAQAVGYSSAVALRTLVRRRLGIGLRARG